MKKALAITAAAVLALLLAACGTERGAGESAAPGGTTATDTMHNDDAQTGVGTSSGASVNDTLRDAANALNRASGRAAKDMPNAADRAVPYAATNNGGVTAQTRYRRMLENARVHDTDGFLLDGENASYRTF